MDLIVWGSTVGIYAFTAVQYYNQVEMGRSRAGDVRAGSTGPRFWTTLSVYGQYYGMIVPQLLYWTTTAYNKFRQPEWLTEYALPKPPDVFGVDGVAVGRGVGLLLVFTGVHLMRKAIKVLGDQLNVIGIREKPKLVDSGPFAYVRHPFYTGNLLMGASFALAFWSYIPLYTLPINIGAHLLKLPIEEGTLMEDPVLGKEYRLYKSRVPYRIIPYVW